MNKQLPSQKRLKHLFCTLCFLLLGIATWGQNVVSLNTTTSTTWTCPAGVTSVQVEAWGGGGGGAGASSSPNFYTGGGGAGGNYARNTSVTVVPGTTYTITIGAGGAAGGTSGTTNNVADLNGGTTSFGTLLYASGGQGGAGGLTAIKAGIGGGNAGILAYTVTSAGSGYSATPSVIVGTAWTASATYTLNQQYFNAGKLYTVTTAGTSGTVAPTHTSGSVAATGGTAIFTYAGTAATAIASTTGTSPNKTVSGVLPVIAGSGYLTTPTVTLSAGNATATAASPTTINVTGSTFYALGGLGGNGTYTATSTTNASGGGGASGGPLGAGNNGVGVTGGTSVTGSGAGANGTSTNATAGTAATEFGGGGSGAVGVSKAGGAGAAGKIVITILDKTPPADPGTLSVPNVAATSLGLNWVASADAANADFTGYLVVRYTSAPAADNDPVQNVTYTAGATFTTGTTPLTGTVVSVGTTTNASDTGLTTGTKYYYKVYAFDSSRNYSNESSASETPANVTDTTPPGNPGTASVANQTASSLTVNWLPATNGTEGGGYLVVRYTGSPETDANPVQGSAYNVGDTMATGTLFVSPATTAKIGSVQYVGNNLTLNQTGLTSEKNYYYRIFTFDAAYNYSAASIVTGKTSVQLSAPVALEGSNATGTGFTANWTPVAASATGYSPTGYTATAYSLGTESTLVGWTFPSAVADSNTITADITTANTTASQLIQNGGGTITTTSISGSSAAGSGTGSTGTAARGATYYSTSILSGTVSGGDVVYNTAKSAPDKYWQVDANTTGYKNIKISSQQYSAIDGPRDFKVQYSSTGASGTFTDLATVTLVASTWNTQVTGIALPAECDNNPNVVLRWSQTSFARTDGNQMTTPDTGGTSRIDNILVKGQKLNSVATASVTGSTTASAAITGLTTGGTYYYDVVATGTNTSNSAGLLTSYASSAKSNLMSYIFLVPEAYADFRSIGTANTSSATNWEYNNGTSWLTATAAPTSTNNITVAIGNEVTLSDNFTINSGKSLTVAGTINLAGHVVSGTGSFVLSSGASLKLGDNTSLSSAITCTTTTLSIAANYFYDGTTVAQHTGGLPGSVVGSPSASNGSVSYTATLTGNITISNPAGVTMNQGIKITGAAYALKVTSTGKLLFGDGNVSSTPASGTFNSGTFNYTGTGNFIAETGSTLSITSSKGISQGTSDGNIKNSGTRTFNSGVNYIFAKNDTFNPISMGSSFGTEINASTGINNLTINDPFGVFVASTYTSTLSGTANTAGVSTTSTYTGAIDITVNGTLNMVSGKLFTSDYVTVATNSAVAVPVNSVNYYPSVSTVITPSDTNTKTVTIGASGTVTGAGSGTGWVVGNLKKLTASGSSPTFTYAIGNATNFYPVALTFSGNTSADGELAANSYSGVLSNIADSGIDTTKKVNRYWSLTNSGLAGFGTYQASFNYANAENDDSTTASSYIVRNYDNAMWNASTISGTPSATTATASGIKTFGNFIIGKANIPAAPSAIAQVFCNTGTVADLVATGTSIHWYAAATGGDALASDVALASGNYYATQTLNGIESPRTSVAITVNVPSVPTAASQAVCTSGTVADLAATGTALKWYSAATGGSALASDVALASGNYYVSQTLNSCESARTLVEVTVNVTSAPAADSQILCASNHPTVANLVTSGTAPKWYAAATGGSALASDVALESGNYYVSQTLNSCESARTLVAVTITNGIAVQPVNTSICTTATTSLASISVVSSGGTPTYEWQYATALAPNTWIKITALNAGAIYTTYTSATLNIKKAATLLTGTKYRVVLTGGLCGAVTSNEVTLSVSPIAVAKAITASSATICTGTGTTLNLATASVGSIQWQKSTTSATDGFENVGAIIAPTTATNGVVSLSTGNLTQDTWYRIVFSSGACSTVTSAVVKVTVSQASSVGTLTSDVSTVCKGSGTTLRLDSASGTIAWWKAPVVNGVIGTYAAVAGNTTTTLTTGNLVATTAYKVVVSSGACSASTSDPITITVSPASVVKTITGAGAICNGGSKTLTLATGSIGAIQWQSNVSSSTTAPIAADANWADIVGATDPATYVATPTTTTWYRVVAKSGPCSSIASAAVKVTVNEPTSVGTLSSDVSTVCKGSGTTLSLDSSAGTIAWWKAPVTNGTIGKYAAVAGNTTTTLTTGVLAATTAYKVVVSSGACSASTSDPITITVSPASVVKTISGAGAICNGGSKTLTLATGSIGAIQWQSNVSSSTTAPIATDANWADIADATDPATYVATPTTTTWYRVVAKSGPCSSIASAAVAVTVSQPTSVGTLNALASTVCTATGTTLSLDGATGTIAWWKAPVANGVIGTYAAVAGNTTTTLVTGNLAATTAYKVVVSSGACSASTSNAITITVSPLAKAAAVTGNTGATTLPTAICTTTTKTLTLGSAAIGAIQWQYYNAGSSTTAVTNTSSVSWTDIPDATLATYTASSSTEGNVWFRVKLTSGPCATLAYSAPVNVWFKSCTSSGSNSSKSIAVISTEFKALTYPNPFTENFKLDIQTSSDEVLQVSVYNMLGQLLDNRTLQASEIGTLELGANYPSGIYNVIVSQGNNANTLRMIKK